MLLLWLAIAAALLTLLLLLPGSTPAIDARAHPGGLALLEQVPVSETRQWVLIRTEDVANPVVLFVHGGPGLTLMPFRPKVLTERQLLARYGGEYHGSRSGALVAAVGEVLRGPAGPPEAARLVRALRPPPQHRGEGGVQPAPRRRRPARTARAGTLRRDPAACENRLVALPRGVMRSGIGVTLSPGRGVHVLGGNRARSCHP